MNKQRSPLFHIVRRGALPWYATWGIRGGAVLLALLVCGVVTMLVIAYLLNLVNVLSLRKKSI